MNKEIAKAKGAGQKRKTKIIWVCGVMDFSVLVDTRRRKDILEVECVLHICIEANCNRYVIVIIFNCTKLYKTGLHITVEGLPP